MEIRTYVLAFPTTGKTDIIDITREVSLRIRESGISEGNVLIFVSPKQFNDYGHALISNPLIYIAEALLLAWSIAHFVTGIQVTLTNRSARPTAYAMKRPAGYTSHKSLASSTMILSGLCLLVFVPLHLWTFKFGADYASAEPGVRDLHRLVVEEFHNRGNLQDAPLRPRAFHGPA